MSRGVSDADCICESYTFAECGDQGTPVTTIPADERARTHDC